MGQIIPKMSNTRSHPENRGLIVIICALITLVIATAAMADEPLRGTKQSHRDELRHLGPVYVGTIPKDCFTSFATAENRETTSGLIMLTPTEGQALDKHHITVTAIAQIGAALRLIVNGKVIDEQKTVGTNEFGIDISKIPQASEEQLTGAWSFVSIELSTGPNQIQVTALDKEYKDSTIQRTVHVIGTPAKIDISASEERLPADGKSQTELTITVRDEWGYTVVDGTFITINLQDDNGQLITPDVDTNTGGTQLRTQNGIGKVILRASKEVGQTTVTAACNQISASKIIRFTTPVHPFMLVGVADAQVGHLRIHGDTGGKYEQGLYNEKRLALYTRGTLFSNYLLTGSYDSARKFQDRLFRDLDPERLYPLYGDSRKPSVAPGVGERSEQFHIL